MESAILDDISPGKRWTRAFGKTFQSDGYRRTVKLRVTELLQQNLKHMSLYHRGGHALSSHGEGNYDYGESIPLRPERTRSHHEKVPRGWFEESKDQNWLYNEGTRHIHENTNELGDS